MPAGVSSASTPVEVWTTSTSTTPGVSPRRLVVSAFVEVSTTSESGGVGTGGGGSDGVGLDLQKKHLEPGALKTRPRVFELGG